MDENDDKARRERFLSSMSGGLYLRADPESINALIKPVATFFRDVFVSIYRKSTILKSDGSKESGENKAAVK